MKKRLLVVVLVFTLLVSVSIAPSTVATDTKKVSKISDELTKILESTEKNEKIEVVLWLEDLDYDTAVDEKVREITGDNKSSIRKIESDLSKSRMQTSVNTTVDTFAEMQKWVTDNKALIASVNTRVDNYIAKERQISAEEYTLSNNKMLSELNIENDDILFVSRYSPLVIVNITADKVNDISRKNLVKEIDVCEEFEDSATMQEEDLNNPSNTPIHAVSIGIGGSYSNLFYNSYNGRNIKIGQIELGVPNVNDSYFNNSSVTVLSGNANIDPHATAVARIMVGFDGLTRSADLYSTYYMDDASFFVGVENLISYNVNVINMSAGNAARQGHTYTPREKWLDHIANIHGVSFVSAAGNDGLSDHKILSPALAYNVITVGAINDMATTDNSDDFLAGYSSYLNYGNSACSKPDIVAPGSPYFGTGGTSFAAPMITSVVASMMNIDPSLKTNPTAVKAILLASCDRKVPGEALGGLTEKQGAGVINYGNIVWIMMNGRYLTAPTSTTQQRIHITTDVRRANIGLAWLRKNYVTSVDHTVEGNIDEVPYTNLDMYLYTDAENYEMGKSETPRSSTELISNYMRSSNGFFKVNIQKPTNSYATTYSLAWY